MAWEYTLMDSSGQTHTVKSPTRLTKAELASKVGSTTPSPKSSNAATPTTAQKIIGNSGLALKTGLSMLGGAVGSTAGPVGAAAGAGLGWEAGGVLDRALNGLVGNTKPQTAKESFTNAAKDLPESALQGMIAGTGGEIKPATAGFSAMRKSLSIPKSYFPQGSDLIKGEEKVVERAIDTNTITGKASIDKTRARMKDINSKIWSLINQGDKAGKTVDPDEVVKHMDALIAERSHDVAPGADRSLAKLKELRNEFMEKYASKTGKSTRQMTLREAQRAKVTSYGVKSSRFNSRQAGDFQTEETDMRNALEKGLKAELEQANPELGKLNEQYGTDVILKKAITNAVYKAGKEKLTLFDMGAIIAGISGGAAAGHMEGGTALGISAVMAKKLLNSSRFQSILALAIRDAAKGVKVVSHATPVKQSAADISLDQIKQFIQAHAAKTQDNSKPWKSIGSEDLQ